MVREAMGRRVREGKESVVPNHHLPTKVCVRCKREFAWRKKWERDWEQVKYCSKKCAATKAEASEPPPEPARDRSRSR